MCNKCGTRKLLTCFYRDNSNKTDGRYSSCKECKNKEIQRWRDKNKPHYNATMRKYYSTHTDQIKSSKLKKAYGVSLEEKNEMLRRQNNSCWICKKTNQSKKRPFAIDHHPTTKKTRGILCYGCNRAIHILDRPELLEVAQAYLKHFA
jgi:prenyltransferase beta subunit